MLKARKTRKGINIYSPKINNNFTFTNTTWEILQAIKKHGEEKATQKIMKLYQINEKNAKEDIQTVLTNLKTLKININEIPTTISEKKYAPRTVQIDITPKCNSKCIYCIVSDRMKDPTELTTKQVISLIDEMSTLEVWLLVISGGEPLLRKDIFQILDYIDKLEMPFWLLTNGMLIDVIKAKKIASLKHLCMLQVSIDSCIPENHDFHRGKKGSFEKSLKGIKNLVKYNVIPDIEMVVSKININDVEKTVDFLHKLGIKSISIGPAFIFSGRGYKNKNNLFLDDEQLKATGRRIIELKQKYKDSMNIAPSRGFLIKTGVHDHQKNTISCSVGHSTLYIAADGMVYPCHMVAEEKCALGDLKKETLEKIWKESSLIKKLRARSRENKCKKCDIKHECNCLSKLN